MFKNRLSRAATKISPNTHPHLFIQRSKMPLDKRLKFVDHVCRVLSESRFGPGAYHEPFPNFRDIPDSKPIDFCDLYGFTTKPQRTQSNTFDLTCGNRAFAVKNSQGRKAGDTTCWECALLRDAKVRVTPSGVNFIHEIMRKRITLTTPNSLGRGSPRSQGRTIYGRKRECERACLLLQGRKDRSYAFGRELHPRDHA